MQFPLKFEFASDKLLPLSTLREKFVRDKMFSEVTQAARLFHEGTQFIDIKEITAAAAVLKSPG